MPNDGSFSPEAQVAVTLSTIAYTAYKGTQEQQRRGMEELLANPKLPTAGEWRLVWGPVTVEENLSYVVEGPAGQYAYAIRGTVLEPKNLIEDFLDSLGLRELPWDPSSDARIADGMVEGWRNLTAASDGGRTALQFLQGVPSGSRLIVTGHSLGAMLAAVMSVYFAHELGSHLEVESMTFAAPTAGDQAFADLCVELFGGAGRFFNCLDIVPKVYNHDDVESIKDLYPCANAPSCRRHIACRGLVDLVADIAGDRYFQPSGGTSLQPRVYSESSGSFKNFLAEALAQHHALHYMYLLGIPLEAIQIIGPFTPPTLPCPCS